LSILVVAYAIYLVALAISGVAFWRGDPPLKLAAVALVAGWTLSALAGHRDRYGMSYPMTIIDTNVTLVFVWISTRWRLIWVAVLAALTAITTAIPFVALADPEIHWYNRAAANNIVASLQLVVLLVGTVLTLRARRRVDEGAVRS
jgi:hypothetical protein